MARGLAGGGGGMVTGQIDICIIGSNLDGVDSPHIVKKISVVLRRTL